MRNCGCVPGHSISAAFHQSRDRGALLLVSVSPYAHLQEQTTDRLPTGSHTLSHSYTHSLMQTCGSERVHAQTHRPTTDNMYIHMAKCTHTNIHIHTVTHQYGMSTPSHHEHETVRSSYSLLGGIHNFLIIIFLWSLQAQSTSEQKKRDYTIHK